MLTCGKRRKKPEHFPDQRVVFRAIPGLAARPHRAAASPRPREAHRRPTARDPAAAANTATPPATAAHTATGGVRGRRWACPRAGRAPGNGRASRDRRPIMARLWPVGSSSSMNGLR